MEQRTHERANLFYHTLDSLAAFRPIVATEDRSLMNATLQQASRSMKNCSQIFASKMAWLVLKDTGAWAV